MIRSGEQALFEAAIRTASNVRAPREVVEPLVCTADVSDLLNTAFQPPHGCQGLHPDVIASRAGVSKRTVYRVLNRTAPYDKPTMSLGTADRLLVAIDKSLNDVRLVKA